MTKEEKQEISNRTVTGIFGILLCLFLGYVMASSPILETVLWIVLGITALIVSPILLLWCYTKWGDRMESAFDWLMVGVFWLMAAGGLGLAFMVGLEAGEWKYFIISVTLVVSMLVYQHRHSKLWHRRGFDRT